MAAPATTPEGRLRKALHDLSLHGSASADEARALGLLSYYLTGATLTKLVAAVTTETHDERKG